MSAFAIALGDGLELRLREARLADEYLAMIERNLDRLAPWEAWSTQPQTMYGMRSWLEHGMNELAAGRSVPAVVVEEGALIGSAGLRIDPDNGVGTLGYWLDGGAEGRGIMTRAAQALVRLGLEDLGLGRIEARVHPDNARSRAVLGRVGLHHEATLARAVVIGGTRHDDEVWALLAPDPLHEAEHDDTGPGTDPGASTDRRTR